MSEQPASTESALRPDAKGRSPRARRVGVVTSAKTAKTIRVEVAYLTRHGKYGKYMRRRTVLHAHDETGQAKEGDLVEVMACRPISKTKSWRLVRVVESPAGTPAQSGA
jgi:small subunit ribosomal protein S17